MESTTKKADNNAVINDFNEFTAILIATLISSIIIPFTATISGVKMLDSEVLHLPYDFITFCRFSNLCIIATLTATLLYFLKYVLYFNFLKKLYISSLYIFTWTLTLVEYFCISKFQLSICPAMIYILGDVNNTSEISSFFELYFNIGTIFSIFLTVMSAWAIWIYSSKISYYLVKFKSIFISCFIILICISLTGDKIGGLSASTPIHKLFYSINHGRKVAKYISKISDKITNDVKIISDKSDTPYIVFVIGESESKHFMGLYNKKYNTTPLSQKLIDSNNLFAFTDSISMKSITALSLPLLLSFMENANESVDISKFDSIIDVFKKANYQTFWISNHEKITKDLSYATCLAYKCNHYAFTSKIPTGAEELPQLCSKDEAVLKPLDDYLSNYCDNNGKNFFVIHLMGSHASYKDRYPDSFNKFKSTDVKEEKLNENQKEKLSYYLNSVLYTDHILNEIITRFKAHDAIMVYVPDQGEELWQDGFIGHAPTNISKYMVEIPMLIWVSNSYKQKRPDNISRIQNSLNEPFMTDNLAHLLLDLANIETTQYDSSKSVINKNYISRPRIINGLKYEDLRPKNNSN